MKVRKLATLSLLIATGIAAEVAAQPAELLADLFVDTGYPGLPPGPVNEPAVRYAMAGDKAFFWAGGGPLAVTDGTPLGTELLPVDRFGTCSGTRRLPLGVQGDVFYWLQCVEDNNRSVLWRSDGSADGTYQLTTLFTLNVPMPYTFSNEVPEEPTHAFAGGALYFQGCSRTNPSDCTLWRTDGTVAGTSVVKAGEAAGPMAAAGNKVFFAGSSDFTSVLGMSDGTATGTIHLRSFDTLGPRLLTAAGGKVFFLAGVGGEEQLWVSDGTTAGTRAVSHFAASQPLFRTRWLKAIGSAVYFLADDGEHGTELWRSDGTSTGTVRMTELAATEPFSDGFLPEHVEQTVGGRVVFLASTDDGQSLQLFATSGTPGSTTALVEVCAFRCGAGLEITERFARAASGRVVFQSGRVWGTDGTSAGTIELSATSIGKPVALLGDVFFGTPGTFGGPFPYRLWRTDGTAAGTRIFADLPANTPLSFAQEEMGVAGGRVLFQARDRFYGLEVWSSDQAGRTQVLGNLTSDLPRGSGPFGFAELQGQLFFAASSPTSLSERRIWRSAGSAATTVPLTGIPSPGCGSNGLGAPFRAGGRIYFVGPGANCGSTLWTTDGTAAGTRALTSLSSSTLQWQEFLGQLVFVVEAGDGSAVLWRSNGTPEGTVAWLPLPTEARDPAHLTALGQQLYFVAENQAWVTDGTLPGTRTLATFGGGFYEGYEPLFTRLGQLVFFRSPFDPGVLWKTDGTPQGTLEAFISDSGDGPAEDLVAFGGTLYFFQFVNGEGDALFRTDGTPAGTVRLYTFDEGVFSNSSHFPVVLGGRLLFMADDGFHGPELWSTDGTAAGTALVRDIFPGEPASLPAFLLTPASFVVAGGRLFFPADDGAHGLELWQTDGTAVGTRMVQDINPGVAGSQPRGFTAVGDRLYFTADDGVLGAEPWFLSLGAAPPCQPGDTHLCLNGGRFRVEAQWKDSLGRVGPGHAVSLSTDTGYFWFFGPANVEVVLKVLDGRPLNDHFWVFYGALSNVEYALTVTDTETGVTRRYFNSQSSLASVGHTSAFGPRGAHAAANGGAAGAPSIAAHEGSTETATGACAPTATRLCLNGGRFAVEVSWKDFAGNTGIGTGVSLTGDTGYFWFFSSSNVEVILKVLDGTPVNGRFWVFFGALSNVEYVVTVTDTTSGKVKTYRNPSGQFASVADTSAF